ncbi:ArsA family ATPase [Diplocloster modestus]|uniref:ArsA family ATPase n=1 Tax=Diplocloster modestus TaxID=2850322 RepID=A0ABS6K794_9FIRM|nr:ArsA family ATPase [Diplocloster modestus]MBU9726378.1 ArsA family ATPase [Diplocloster modestus]
MSRIYIFTGKGGVGKTSVSAAHAVLSAGEGKRTLLVSTDMAHNLGDVFEVKLGKEPVCQRENLDLYEIDPNYVMEQDFWDIMECIGKMLPDSSGKSMEDFGMLPGMEELFSLLKIAEIRDTGAYERIIVDCAPTGETLSLLKFPELLSWYMEKLFPMGKVAMRVLSPVSKRLFELELPNRQAMTDIERMYLKLIQLQELLKDRNTTSIRLVAIPEKMVVEETKRNYMYMNLYNFNVDGLYINRVIPADIGNPFFDEWLKIQKKYITQLEESFREIPLCSIPWYEEEVRGTKAVERICKDALSGKEVFESSIQVRREQFEQVDDGYILTVFIPNARKEELDVYQTETEAVIRLGNYKRNIPLPNALKTYMITSAKLEDGKLRLRFRQECAK